MKSSIKFFLFVIPLLSFNCSSSDSESLAVVFTTSKILTAKTLISSESLQDPWIISVVDSALLIANYKATPLLEVYNFSGKLIGKALPRADKDFNVLTVGGIQPEGHNKAFYVYDLFGKKTIKYKFRDINNISTYTASTFMDYSDSTRYPRAVTKFFIGNDVTIGDSRSPFGRILLSKYDGSFLSWNIQQPPKVYPDFSDSENSSLYVSSISISPDKSKIALVTNYAGLFDLYRITPSGIDSIWSYNEFPPSGINRVDLGDGYKVARSGNSVYGYSDISVSNKFAYALFSGKKVNEDNYSFGSIIRIVSWDGKRILQFGVDRLVNRIAVSSDDKLLYAIAINDNDNPEIVVFNIKNIWLN